MAARSGGSTSVGDPRPRIASLDILRGVVMVLMALDHVRVFSGIPAGGRTVSLFFTRWVTHFCAPAFIFLAGVGIFLYGEKVGGRAGRGALARFLLVRGAWLVLLELTVIRFSWTFNFDYAHYALAGVIWVIGWCMILMAALVYVPPALLGVLALVLVAGHDLMDSRFWDLADTLKDRPLGGLWKLLYFGFAGDPISFAGTRLTVLYSLVPWIGVMALGYAFGRVVEWPSERRRDFCLKLGAALTLGFLVLRLIDHYGDPVPWTTQRSPIFSVLSFFNVEKYPPSLDYLLVTLGPALVLFAFAPKLAARSRFLVTFGKVPLLFYVAHLFLLRYTSIPIAVMRFGAAAAFTPPPKGAGGSPEFPLWVTYAVWLVSLVLLYPLCRWYARLKATKKSVWLSYL